MLIIWIHLVGMIVHIGFIIHSYFTSFHDMGGGAFGISGPGTDVMGGGAFDMFRWMDCSVSPFRRRWISIAIRSACSSLQASSLLKGIACLLIIEQA